MNETLRDFINKTCVVYLDDILIFSTSLKEHVKAITDIFTVLERANLKIQIDKCNFMKRETEFLGHILTKEGLKPNPNKIKVIQELDLPKTEKQIKSFLGLTGYYRKFVRAGTVSALCPREVHKVHAFAEDLMTQCAVKEGHLLLQGRSVERIEYRSYKP